MADIDFGAYKTDVLDGGDGGSHAKKSVTDRANEQTSTVAGAILTGRDGELQLGEWILSLGTDGVGTKVRIYMRQYENYYLEYIKSNKEEEDTLLIQERTIELCDRMISDLIAMLYDDGIKGERAIAFTNIIDTNTTSGEKSDIFHEAFKIALGNSIISNDAKCLNGETANLGETDKFVRALERYKESGRVVHQQTIRLKRLKDGGQEQLEQSSGIEGADGLLDYVRGAISEMEGIIDVLSTERRAALKDMISLYRELELNLAGTFLGLKSGLDEHEKLVEMEAGDIVIVLSEDESENGVHSPRSNGLTLVRKKMKHLMGDNWENKTFEDYIRIIGDKESQVPDALMTKLAGLKMWDIATGKTTIFNTFIADDLMGGPDGTPIAKISGLRHGTGNPLFKLFSGLQGSKDLMYDLDISDIVKPEIFILLQIAFGISDEDAAEPWNSGIPYHIVCKPGEEDKILKTARLKKKTATIVGTIKERGEGDPSVRIKGVGIGKSTIEYSKDEEEETV